VAEQDLRSVGPAAVEEGVAPGQAVLADAERGPAGEAAPFADGDDERETLRRVEGLDDPDVSSAALERSTEVLRGRIGYEPVSPEQRLPFLRALLHAIEQR